MEDEIKEAYNAPFPDESYKAAARQFPIMFPRDKEDPEGKTNALLREKLKTFNKPFLTIWGITKMKCGREKIKSCNQKFPVP